jgi:hypothetical protein
VIRAAPRKLLRASPTNKSKPDAAPRTSPSFQSITWNSFTPASYGTGTINDANRGLDGPFTRAWDTTTQTPASGYRRAGQLGRAIALLLTADQKRSTLAPRPDEPPTPAPTSPERKRIT